MKRPRIETTSVQHEFPPVFDTDSKILILGSIPSPKSRQQGFYYGHPRNCFWKVMADVLGESIPQTIIEKQFMLLKHQIAIWDVLKSCEIHGADDSSIRNPIPNDMDIILKHAKIQCIFTTGSKASVLYRRYCFPKTEIPAIQLPSTSPANCRMGYEALRETYKSAMIEAIGMGMMRSDSIPVL